MIILPLDFETFFSDEYTLKKLTTEEYIRDPRFEAHGCAFQLPSGELIWRDGTELPALFAKIDWANTGILAHHAHFDALILSHHYGVRPAFIADTMSMGLALLGNHIRVGLESLAKHFNLQPKSVPYNLFKGYHWHELSEDIKSQVRDGAMHDVRLMKQIFDTLTPSFPLEEFTVVDTTIRMFTEPVLEADEPLLIELWQAEEVRRNGALDALGVTAKQLGSNDQFAELLIARGVEPGLKRSPADPSLNIYAFAKSDDFMQALLEDDDEEIQALAEARLGIKSTLMQTRAERMGGMNRRGKLCVYLKYCAAHTKRWGGGDKMNWQNFKRDDRDAIKTKKATLRRSVKAPPGYLCGIIDQSQIECRLLNFFAGQWDVVELFRTGKDPYLKNASAIYGREIDPSDKERRGTGKQGELSCGYGCGGPKFQAVAKLGIYGPKAYLDDAFAQHCVDTYRATHPCVTGQTESGAALNWRVAGRMIARLAGGAPLQWGPLCISDHRLWLPNGLPLIYDTLEYHYDDQDAYGGYWRFRTRNGWEKLYGAKLIENAIQALGRVATSQAMVRIRREGFKICTTAHDEVMVMIANDQYATQNLEFCRQEMKRAEGWLEGVPLDAEATLSERYEK